MSVLQKACKAAKQIARYHNFSYLSCVSLTLETNIDSQRIRGINNFLKSPIETHENISLKEYTDLLINSTTTD